MARQINLFNFTGKLGNVVGYRYKGKYCLRSLPVRKNKTVTLVQLVQQEKFAIAGKFVRSLAPVLAFSIPDPKKMTQSNFVMSHTLKKAMYGTYPNFHIDYSQVPVSRGHLASAWSEKATTASGNIIFSWMDNSIHNGVNAKGDDKAILVAYCEVLNKCVYSINSINRQTAVAVLPADQFMGFQVQTWLGFISANGKLISNSTYTGAMYMT